MSLNISKKFFLTILGTILLSACLFSDNQIVEEVGTKTPRKEIETKTETSIPSETRVLIQTASSHITEDQILINSELEKFEFVEIGMAMGEIIQEVGEPDSDFGFGATYYGWDLPAGAELIVLVSDDGSDTVTWMYIKYQDGTSDQLLP